MVRFTIIVTLPATFIKGNPEQTLREKRRPKMKSIACQSDLLKRTVLFSGLCLVLSAAGCGRTTITAVNNPIGDSAGKSVATEKASVDSISRPDRILVYDFAVTPRDVSLDRALDVRLLHHLERVSQSEEQLKAARAVARALSIELVAAIRKLGLPVQRADEASPATGRTLAIKGVFVSIGEGNSLRRLVIGLGVGATEVKTLVQVYLLHPPGRQLWQSFETAAQSSRMPGMAETLGVGTAAMGARAVAIGAGAQIGAQYGGSVAADARRTADAIAKKLSRIFAVQGWIPADRVR
jgi:Domain of unknown function (DUF4410)